MLVLLNQAFAVAGSSLTNVELKSFLKWVLKGFGLGRTGPVPISVPRRCSWHKQVSNPDP